ncbi:MAG TPA: methyltransferase domain-containing protein [Acidimicrobiales bacterium]|nr:methyltransferase domain-containing protein [Acidimicrobiales bacterium]
MPLLSRAGRAARLLREPRGARRLAARAAERAAPLYYRDLPPATAVRLAHEVVLRRGPTAAEADAAAAHGNPDRFLDLLCSAYGDLPEPVAIRLGYLMVLRREPDPEGEAWVRGQMADGHLDRYTFLDWLHGTGDFVRLGYGALGPSLHASRCQFVRSLPKAARILDLGGTDLGHAEGALVHMGYPYDFAELVLVDLAPADRHPLYQRQAEAGGGVVATERGPVRYEFHSMTDLSRYEAASFDLVYSGQTFEHVTEDEGDVVLEEVARVLAPGGAFALDTPNATVCRRHQEGFIDPDHKVEYDAAQLEAKLAAAGFAVEARRGLNYAGPGPFSAEATARNPGVFADAEDCYLLAYVCRLDRR